MTSSKDGLQYKCKECKREYQQQNKERIKEYREINKERIRKQKKEYYQKNKDKAKEYQRRNKERIAEYQRNWREANGEYRKEYQRNWREANGEYHKEYQRSWREANGEYHKEYHKEYYKERYKNDPTFRLRHLVSRAIGNALRNNNSSKEGSSTWDALSYTPQQLREHLEAQFEEGMSWDNYGHDGWHIDHIYPQSKLPYESMTDENFKIAWSLKNLRPLWAAENISKGNQIIEGAEELLLEIKKDLFKATQNTTQN